MIFELFLSYCDLTAMGVPLRLRPSSPRESRFRHRICSFIWVETAKRVFTTEDGLSWPLVRAHKSAAETGRPDF
jgi:hypothetical protein